LGCGIAACWRRGVVKRSQSYRGLAQAIGRNLAPVDESYERFIIRPKPSTRNEVQTISRLFSGQLKQRPGGSREDLYGSVLPVGWRYVVKRQALPRRGGTCKSRKMLAAAPADRLAGLRHRDLAKQVDQHLMELLLMMDALKRASAESARAHPAVLGCLPYYGFARQAGSRIARVAPSRHGSLVAVCGREPGN